jgi:EAL domain-containing protein (putative c-di-GMP-specific phosphodiesterase class I)/GGDEF domain-containing protein
MPISRPDPVLTRLEQDAPNSERHQGIVPMSLTKQLWLAITAVTSLVFAGTFIVSTLAARHYLEEEVYVANVDNATALALSMSQMAKDPVTLDLQVSSQFDAGHYRRIRLTDPSGKVLAERINEAPAQDVPGWFLRLIPFDIRPGVAQIQDGWKQFATLSVETNTNYAYSELWRGTVRLGQWFLLAAAITGLVGSALLRFILQPLQEVVIQADAIGARRFITTREPRTTEFRSVVRAMNGLSERVHVMLTEESRRVDELRRLAQIDPLTGLLNRESFLDGVTSQLTQDKDQAAGTLGILRVAALADLNQHFGREVTDQFLQNLGQTLQQVLALHPGWLGGRLNGADYVVLAPDEVDARAVRDHLMAAGHRAADGFASQRAPDLAIGATPYTPGEPLARLLARMDSALAAAEASGQAQVLEAPAAEDFSEPTDSAGWRSLLEAALVPGQVRLGSYPVVARDGRLIHREAPARLRLEGEWQPAVRFIAWASRLGLLPKLDALVMDAALAHIASTGDALGINLSPDSIQNPAFVNLLTTRLRGQPRLAAGLWLEVPEYGAFHHLDAFRAFCLAMKSLGCHIGLEHVGPRFSRIGELHDLGLDYLKIDAAMIRGIDAHPGNQAFLRGLCMVAHTIGLAAIAEGVSSTEERRVLLELGVDGLTGPAITIA